MKFRRVVTVTMIACMLFLSVACNKTNNTDSVKVTVNGQAITVGEFDKMLTEYMAIYESQYGEELWDEEIEKDKTYKEYLEEMVLDTMILEIVLTDEAKKVGIEVSDEQIQEEFKSYKEYFTSDDEYNKFLEDSKMTEAMLLNTIKKELTIKEFLQNKSEQINELVPTDEELRALYNEKPELFNKIRASHILVSTEDEAKQAKDRLESGEGFEDLAKELSSCPSSEEGGDLGYFAYGDMVEEFSKVAFAMKVGEISEPVKSTFGYHVIKVTDIKNSYELIDQEDLDYQYKTVKYNEMLDKYISNAKIEK